MNPEGWKELKSLSTELSVSTGEHVTMQALATEAINTLLEAHGKPPAA
ncbi:ribbon-helix-helix domain-containing protein [Mesorhizobium yinganensis]